MPQIVLDENVHRKVKSLLQSWITVEQIGHEVGRSGMTDQNIIPGLLLEVKRVTFITHDERLYRRCHPHAGYCLIILPERSAAEVASFMRRLFRLQGFRTVRSRMGKVIQITEHNVRWKEPRSPRERILSWPRKEK